MSSLVADFIINPVLRQARRLSEISRSVSAGDGGHAGATAPLHAVSDCGDHGEAPAEEPSPDEDHAGEPAPDESPALPETPRSTHADVSADEAGADGVALPDQPPHDHLGFPLASRRGRALPEDDGMQGLRVRIHAVNARDIASAEKARLMHEILLEGYRASRAGSRAGLAPSIPESNEAASEVHEQPAAAGPLDSLMFWNGQSGDAATERFNLSETDVAPTYAPIRQSKTPGTQTPVQTPTTPQGVAPPLGCQHYERNVKLQCSTCSKWYTCRFCHDAREDHSLVRKDTKNMLCMLCGTPQRASDVCIRCGETAAQYYCNICKLWENRQTKPIYHCNDCGICRRGLGLGKDFFHCKTCRACITTSIQSSHKCIERSTDCDCPICGEYMFTSPKPVVFMPCGHSIHKKCYQQHMRVSYKCPICNKSLTNMETQFLNLDLAIQAQPMPREFQDTKATVLCNDCSGRSTVAYHWLGLKCSICRSYNTVELQMHGEGSSETADMAGEASSAAAEALVAATQDAPRQDMVSAGSRGGTWIPNRRRHSSHGVELLHRAPDRVARSLSPLPSAMEAHGMQPAADGDSEDDFLGLWRGADDDDGSSDQEDDDESEQESDGLPDLDDDEDDEDEITLIGHR